MNKIFFTISDGAIDISKAPEISPQKPFLKKGINILRKKFPGFIKHIEKARGISRIKKLAPCLHNDGKIDKTGLEKLVIKWKSKERVRLLIMFIIELLLLPISILFAVVPGPNIFGYLLVILVWFHFPALIGIIKLDPKKLTQRLLDSSNNRD